MKSKLPDYMVPSAFVIMEALPLSPNGKVDRPALPAPDQARPELEQAFVAPRDELELQLTKIWEKVLDIQPVGVTDNFFDLGGHSLLAVALFSRIEQFCGRKLPLATLFRAPTVEQLAHALRADGWNAPWSSLVPLQPGGSRLPFFLASPGVVMFARSLAQHLGPDQPFYGLQAPGLDDDSLPFYGVKERAAHHVKEIRSLQPEGPYLLGGRCYGGFIVFEIAQQLRAQGQDVPLLVILDSGPPIRLNGRGPRRRGRASHPPRALSVIRLRSMFAAMRRQARRSWRWARAQSYDLRVRLFGSPEERRLLKLMDLNNKAGGDYRASVYDGRITLIRSKEFAALNGKSFHLGWAELAGEGLDCQLVSGNHVTMFREPHVEELAERLRACLDPAQPGT